MSEKWEAVCLDDKKYTSRIDVKTDKIEIALRAGVHWAIATNKEKQKEIHRIVKLAAAAPEMLELLKGYIKVGPCVVCNNSKSECNVNPCGKFLRYRKAKSIIKELEGK